MNIKSILIHYSIKTKAMFKTILLSIFTFVLLSATAQVQTQVIGDSVFIHGNTGKSELILQNSTDLINGFLFNRGAGRTEFRHALIKIDDSTYLVGVDTLHIASNPNGSQASNAWNISGNVGMIAGTNFIGTIDNTELMFKVNNILAGRTGKGSFSNTSFGAKSQPITGTGDFNASFGSLASANLRSGAKNTDIGYEAGFNNLIGNFNTRVGEGANIWDTSSSYNVVLGTEALNHTSLTKIPGGGFNTALGAFALNKHGVYRANIGLGYFAGNGLTGNNTLFVSDSAYHMYFKLDSATGTAPNVISKDANGFWHVYQAPSAVVGSGGGTVTSISTGYGLLGGPITTSGTITVDTSALHLKFLGLEDSTIYYPYASNPKNYLSTTGPFPNHAVPYGNGTNQLTYDATGFYYDGNNLNAGHSDFYSTTGLSLNGGRGYLGASGFGLTIKTNGGAPEDASKSIWFYNSNNPYLQMSMGSTTDSVLYSRNWMTIYPAIDKKFDLGKPASEWNNLYVHKIIADSIVSGGGSGSQSITFAPTGDVTGSFTGTTTITPTLAIGTNKVLNSMLAQVPALTIKGNSTGTTANTADLTGAEVNTILPVFNATSNGLVPLSGGSAGKVLHGDGVWRDTTAIPAQGIISVQEDGTALSSRPTLNFSYGISATDNSGSTRTDVDINLSTGTNSLSTDVPMSSSGIFYDGGSVSLAAGTWLVTTNGTIESTNNNAMRITGKIWDGTSVYSASEGSVGAIGGGVKGYVNLSMNNIITLTSTTTIKASYASTISNCTIKATPGDNNTGTTGKTTSITAVRIK